MVNYGHSAHAWSLSRYYTEFLDNQDAGCWLTLGLPGMAPQGFLILVLSSASSQLVRGEDVKSLLLASNEQEARDAAKNIQDSPKTQNY